MRKTVFLFIYLFFFTDLCCTASDRFVINCGYSRNSSKLRDFPVFENPFHRHLHGINFSVGKRKKHLEYGLYYGIGQIRQFSEIHYAPGMLIRGNDTIDGLNAEVIGGRDLKHVFGVYSNLILSSFIGNKDASESNFIFYAVLKAGGYYIRDDGYYTWGEDSHKGKLYPYGAGFNCFAGLGASYYFLKRMGIFGEAGYDYYPVFKDYVRMNHVAFRAGITIRI